MLRACIMQPSVLGFKGTARDLAAAVSCPPGRCFSHADLTGPSQQVKAWEKHLPAGSTGPSKQVKACDKHLLAGSTP